MAKVKRKDIAEWLSMSPGHLSEIFNNKKDPGRTTYERFAQACPGYHWTDFAKMTGPEIETVLKQHLTDSLGNEAGRSNDRRGDDRRAGLERRGAALAARGQ